jgi:hypothetical protein
MSETAIERWRSERAARMADLYGLYDDAAGTAAGARPAAVEQLRLMLVVALAAEWQGFARDLYEDAVERITDAMAQRETAPLARLLRVSLLLRRRLERGNADQSALSDDFGQLALSGLWARLDQRTSQGPALRRGLAEVMAARNAVAHSSETQLEALEADGVTIDVDTVHGWQTALDELATLLDALVAEHVDTLTRSE